MDRMGERLFLFVTLSVVFSYATPASWWADCIFLSALLGLGTTLNGREARVW